ncbi:hypothetical protein CHLNCDRAFT_144183 [Chlorella variabilis]|uniref:Laminin EGF-like domain-containing protein n=1 Tax=Chlorella variabilis TaxID=554065 RepID=E1ZC38_CHLVA|nr:hypothetical protein CHLNCDRAFT_144183 [Chlorella variabilis]EFN56540.1 hypothetical protein CHLNCDRAFT_144183 [Chlorella variabilis]|eukprot:XP_005848642.1 hypothetical protein CHLNCDRAFT_144183 [Chlorella variabilis]
MRPLQLYEALLMLVGVSGAVQGMPCRMAKGWCIACNPVDTTKCSVCLSGYSPDATGACKPCPRNCTACTPAVGARKPSMVPGCQVCTLSVAKCSYCGQGFATNFTSGACTQCAAPNCAFCFADAKTGKQGCSGCLPGFLPEFPKPSNSSGGASTTCKVKCRDPHCTACLTHPANCAACASGYGAVRLTPTTARCVRCRVPGCQSCTNAITCTACLPTHVLDVFSGSCIRVRGT